MTDHQPLTLLMQQTTWDAVWVPAIMPVFVVIALFVLAAFWEHLIVYNYDLHYIIMMLRL